MPSKKGDVDVREIAGFSLKANLCHLQAISTHGSMKESMHPSAIDLGIPRDAKA